MNSKADNRITTDEMSVSLKSQIESPTIPWSTDYIGWRKTDCRILLKEMRKITLQHLEAVFHPPEKMALNQEFFMTHMVIIWERLIECYPPERRDFSL